MVCGMRCPARLAADPRVDESEPRVAHSSPQAGLPRSRAPLMQRCRLTEAHGAIGSARERASGRGVTGAPCRDEASISVELQGRPTFPILDQLDSGRPVRVGRGVLPSMHSFRHTVASRAFLAGSASRWRF